ncbi:IS30 family transposase, partial [Candidatus Peregrinibacteria bacterium]|nr:IS30 family transposase [Candidatus Peregrinibacteria bacterium]MBI5414656.1 IS30 family transposase [Candidatus Peregrinibacteria bacterium]MBI5414666.1 IS30 family transposase [Candidatus Peregrinibacteria bacterium]
SKVSEEKIYAVQEKLNDRPRKSLRYRTPNEVISDLL